MKLSLEHPWDLSPRQAIELQQQLAGRVERHDRFGEVQLVGGVDVGFEDRGKTTRAAIVVLRLPDLEVVETAVALRPTSFPYVPGLLSFREVPAVLDALARLSELPDVLFCDGHGLIHPRRFGIACHLGVLTGLPTVGIGKSRFVGRHRELPAARGSWVPLEDRDEVIGAVLRSRARVRPIYVSTGHRVGLGSAIALTLRLLTRYRLPETTRLADRLASECGALRS